MYFPIIFFIAFILSLLGVIFVRKINHKYSLLLQPKEDRWHEVPIAVHGGFGFFPPFLALTLFTSALFLNIDLIQSSELDGSFYDLIFIIALCGSSIALMILGWLDDISDISPTIKLFWQILISLLFIMDAGSFQISDIQIINTTFTLIWFVGIINATNFIDCMDGLCAGSLIIISLGILLVIGLAETNIGNLFHIKNILIILLGCLLGYFMLNVPPAKIFMGDSGSLPLGFIIAALALPTNMNGYYGYENVTGNSSTIVAISIMCYPIFDTTLVAFTRILKGRKFYIGGEDHSSHIFVKMGLSERKSLAFCLLISIIGQITAISIIASPANLMTGFISLLLILLTIGFIIGKYSVKHDL